MVLIADSGASKTDWRVLHKDGQISQFRGIGFNPYYLSVEEMTQQLKQDFLLNISNQVEEIYYYGAGCAAPEKKLTLNDKLKNAFCTQAGLSAEAVNRIWQDAQGNE